MSEKTVVQKMGLKEGATLALLNAPAGWIDGPCPLPGRVAVLTEPSLSANVTLVFVNANSELQTRVDTLKSFLQPQAVLWVAFRKGTSRPRPDFNRDDVLACAQAAGLKSLTLISLDADWSAFKFTGA